MVSDEGRVGCPLALVPTHQALASDHLANTFSPYFKQFPTITAPQVVRNPAPDVL